MGPAMKAFIGGCLYILWQHTDHVVMFVLPKQQWHHLPDNFTQSPQHQQHHVTTLSTPMTKQTNKHNAGSPTDASLSFGQVCFFY